MLEDNNTMQPDVAEVNEVEQGQASVGMSTSDAPITSDDVQPTEQEMQVDTITIGHEISSDERDMIYGRLGRPDSVDGYDLNEIIPKNYNHELVDEFKSKAFAQGMSADGVKEMATWYKSVEEKQLASINKTRQEQSDYHMLELKREWGADFDNNVKQANKAVDAYTDKGFRKYMDESGLGNHPALVKAFAKIGRELSNEDSLVHSETSTTLKQNAALQRSEIARMRSDRAFMDRYRRGDPVAVKRLNDLYNIK